jgi:hypothetical protein
MKKFIKLFPLFVLLILVAATSIAQKRTSPKASAENTINDVTVKMVYHQPAVDGRTIYGDLVPLGKVWRTGANNATTFEVNKDVTINGEKLPAGTYAFFTIPEKGEWTVILNSDSGQWGAYDYDKSKDILRVKVKAKTTKDSVERLTFTISDSGQITYTWEKMSFTIDVKAAK